MQSDEIFKELIEVIFMSGASTMYAELAPLVEWVSVKDRLPENMKKILIKGFIYGRMESSMDIGRYYNNDFHSGIDKPTHWRRIEL